MKNNKKYFQKLISILLLFVFVYCAAMPVYAYSSLSGKTKVLQKETKAKTDQGDFVVEEEEINDADDDLNISINIDLAYSISFSIYSFIHPSLPSKVTYNCYYTQTTPLFITNRIFRI